MRAAIEPEAIGERSSRRAIRRESATTFPDKTRRGACRDVMCLPVLPFASCFAYSPGGSGPVCEQGRLLCARLKAADESWLPRLVAQVWLEAVGHGCFASSLDGGILVPVPGSAPGQRAPWVGERLAWCLKELGLATEVWPVLRRSRAVRKSAFAPAGERPSVLEHYASFAIDRATLDRPPIRQGGPVCGPNTWPPRLTLVDDVITRGRTLLAAAGRLRAAFPCAEIRAFALLRTLPPGETPSRLLDPCEGEVRWVLGDARRVP